MNILKFTPRKVIPLVPVKKKARQKATLVLVAIPAPDSTPGLLKLSGVFNGTLRIGEFELTLDDGHPLGMIAYVCGTTSVTITSPSFAGGILLSGHRNLPIEVQRLDAEGQRIRDAGLQLKKDDFFDECVFFRRVHTGLRQCVNSHKDDQRIVDWMERDLYPLALAQVPQHLRVNLSLKRGVYDEKGVIVTPWQIAQKAKLQRMINFMQNPDSVAGASGLGFINLPWNHIVRMPDAHEPVAINGPAYIAVQRMLIAQGFPRMPQSFAELHEGHEFCESVTTAHHNLLIDPGYESQLRDIVLKVQLKASPKTFPLFKACFEKDQILIAKLQSETDWLALLAQDFKERKAEEHGELFDLTDV